MLRRMDQRVAGQAFFFLHIRKTAGTTLVRRVQKNFTSEEWYPTPSLGSSRSRFDQKTSPDRLFGEPRTTLEPVRFFSLHQPLWVRDELQDRFSRDFFTITVLRDPIERTVSHVKQLARVLKWTGPLDEFYEYPRVRNGLCWNNQLMQFAITRADHDAMTARGWTAAFGPSSEEDAENPPIVLDDERLAAARARLATVDAIGFTEGVTEFVDALAQRFGWTVPSAISANVNPDREMPSRLRELVERDAGPDVAFYEYAREFVAKRGEV